MAKGVANGWVQIGFLDPNLDLFFKAKEVSLSIRASDNQSSSSLPAGHQSLRRRASTSALISFLLSATLACYSRLQLGLQGGAAILSGSCLGSLPQETPFRACGDFEGV